MADARKHLRRRVDGVTVRCRHAQGGEAFDGRALDIGKGGLFVATAAPPRPGTLLQLELSAGDVKLVVAARVEWRREKPLGAEPAGAGLRFVRLDRASRKALMLMAPWIAPAVDGEPQGRVNTLPGVPPTGSKTAAKPPEVKPQLQSPPVSSGHQAMLSFLLEHLDVFELVFDAIRNKGVERQKLVNAIKREVLVAVDDRRKRDRGE